MFNSESLIHWFLKEKRDLPWRNNPSPYAVWISEVMLQQTQVAVVTSYFERWMDAFPTISALASASLEEVMKLWEGLGYYSRARNLHVGARYIVENFKGQLPDNYEELAKIKGLGPYTIGAILSFAFHQKCAAVDGNVMRVLSRYFAIEEDLSKSKTQQTIRQLAHQLLPSDKPWLVVEGLIELGATICQRKPNCRACPLKNSCQAYIKGLSDRLPIKSAKIKTVPLFRAVAIIENDRHFLVRQVKPGEVMAGLHEFPYIEVSEASIKPEQLIQFIQKRFHIQTVLWKTMPKVSHAFTRYQVRLSPFHLKCLEKKEFDEFKWLSIDDLKKVAFSAGHRKIFLSLQSTR